MTDAELLTAIESALSGTLDRNAASISINGRSITSLSFKELMDARDNVKAKIAKAAGSGRAAVVRFRNPV